MKQNFITVFLVILIATCQSAFSAEEPLKPDNNADWETRLEYARVLSYLKKYDDSLQEYQKVLELKPDSNEARLEIAKVYYYQKDYDKALKVLKELPNNLKTPEIELTIADIYLAKKDYPQATAIYKKNLNAIPDKKDSILLRLAEINSWEKNYKESLAIYRDLLSRHSNDIQLQRKYAMVLLWSGNHKEAAEILKRTLD